MSRARLEPAVQRIRMARIYSKTFLRDLTPDEWFWQPSELATHIAWQVAHIAAAQYALCLMRMRGKSASDVALISETFFDQFKRGSEPTAAESSPPLAEIERVFDAVHHQSLAELGEQSDESLDVPVDPHPAFKTKLEAVEFASVHELVHAGQIGLLRRLMGKPPLR
jgi:uncharacterized damage-inducible protein DinB